MAHEGLEPFDVSETAEPAPAPESKPKRRAPTVAEKRYLCVTIVDHNAALEGTGDQSYINLRIPVAMAEAGLRMVPREKLGEIDPALVVEMVEEGAVGELIHINEQRKTISIRVE